MQAHAHRSVQMGCTMLLGTEKKGILKPDEDGYYTVVLGAYGAHNSQGMFYDLNSALPFFQKGSQLLRQIEKGVLRGEHKHPEPDLNIRDERTRQMAFINRVREIDSDRVSHHIRAVRLEEGQKDDKGRPIMVVVGEIKPAGPYGNVIREALENPHENVYFSVRSLTMDDRMRGVKYTREIITWDYVNEGGIFNAQKYRSPALESFSEVEITPTDLWALAEEDRKRQSMGLESRGVDYDALASDLGWSKTPKARNTKPSYVEW